MILDTCGGAYSVVNGAHTVIPSGPGEPALAGALGAGIIGGLLAGPLGFLGGWLLGGAMARPSPVVHGGDTQSLEVERSGPILPGGTTK